MRRIAFFVGILLWCLLPPGMAAARHKTGPVTIRGIATHVRATDFELRTTTRGLYQVLVLPATTITEKGVSGRIKLREGDHVGVRGFVSGRRIRAMTIRIYPIKPKPYSVKGTVVSVHGATLVIEVGGKRLTVTVTGATVVRIGHTPGSLKQIVPGERLEARVQPEGTSLLALHLHVFVHKAPQRHVKIEGTITSVSATSLAVTANGHAYTIALTPQTVIYLGNARSSVHALAPGRTVTVYACCAGQALMATSIHVRKSPAARKVSETVRGEVVAVGAGQLVVAVGSSHVVITLTLSTVVEVGSAPARASDIRIGDVVSVRAYRQGNALVAERVHVYDQYRRMRSVHGTILVVNRTGLTIQSRGKRYVVRPSPGARLTLDGRTIGLAGLAPGEKVVVVGHLDMSGEIVAGSIAATRVLPKEVTLRGTLVSVRGAIWIVADDAGTRHQIRLAAGARVLWNGSRAPAGVLFPGVRVLLKGTVSGGVLIASAATIEVKQREVKGRMIQVGSGRIELRITATTTVTVDLPPGAKLRDQGKSIARSSLQVGAYASVGGYELSASHLRAFSLRIIHPTLSLAAMVTGITPFLVVQIADGEQYVLHVDARSRFTSERGALPLSAADVPLGARAHVDGVMRSDGELAVARMTVRLSSASVDGTVKTLDKASWTVMAASGPITIRLTDQTAILQGSHVLAANDVVAGDAVTVDGYSIANRAVIARKILVHRRLAAFDGTIAALTADGFTLKTTSGDHPVIVSPSTTFSGGVASDLTAGLAVHVTGYLRGDGAILATRIRLGKKNMSRLASSPRLEQRLHQAELAVGIRVA